MPALLKAVVCQLLALTTLLLAAWLWRPGFSLPAIAVAGLQGLFAGAFSRLLRQPPWWLPIHLTFVPALLLTQHFSLPNELFLSGFLLLLLVFWSTAKGEVPLFLSSQAVATAISEIVDSERAESFLELGAGVGSVVVPLAQRCPTLRIDAIENAPLPWLILRWRCRKLNNVRVMRENFWQRDFGGYSLVFGFLSPAVMAKIEAKGRREMPGRGLLVSSSFVLPNRQAQSTIVLNDRRKTKLYCYRFATPYCRPE